MHYHPFGRIVPRLGLLLYRTVLPQSVLYDKFPVVINPFLIFPYAVLLTALHLEVPPSVLKTLLLNDLLDFSTHCRQLLELLGFESVELSSNRNPRENPHGIDFLGTQTHKRAFLFTEVNSSNFILQEVLVFP